MRWILLLTAALTAVGCASGPAGSDSVQETVTIAGGGLNTDVRISRDRHVEETGVSAPRDAVWRTLSAAFVEVGLPEPSLDEGSWTAFVRNHVVRRRLGDERLSRLLECGRGLTQPHADTHRVYLTVTARLEEGPSGEGTTLHTEVGAVADNPEGTTARITCSSRGVLEGQLADAVQRLAGG